MFRLEPEDHKNEVREMIRFFVRLKQTSQNEPKIADVVININKSQPESEKPKKTK